MKQEFTCEITCIDQAKFDSVKERFLFEQVIVTLADTFKVLGD